MALVSTWPLQQTLPLQCLQELCLRYAGLLVNRAAIGVCKHGFADQPHEAFCDHFQDPNFLLWSNDSRVTLQPLQPCTWIHTNQALTALTYHDNQMGTRSGDQSTFAVD